MEDDFRWAPDYGRQVDKYYGAPTLCVPKPFSGSITEEITYRQHTMFSLLCFVLAALAQHLGERVIVETRHVLGRPTSRCWCSPHCTPRGTPICQRCWARSAAIASPMGSACANSDGPHSFEQEVNLEWITAAGEREVHNYPIDPTLH